MRSLFFFVEIVINRSNSIFRVSFDVEIRLDLFFFFYSIPFNDMLFIVLHEFQRSIKPSKINKSWFEFVKFQSLRILIRDRSKIFFFSDKLNKKADTISHQIIERSFAFSIVIIDNWNPHSMNYLSRPDIIRLNLHFLAFSRNVHSAFLSLSLFYCAHVTRREYACVWSRRISDLATPPSKLALCTLLYELPHEYTCIMYSKESAHGATSEILSEW